MSEGKEVAISGDDLSALDTVVPSSKGAKMEVRGINGEVLRHGDGRPFTITYRGRDSEELQAVFRTQSDKRISATMRTRNPILTAVVQKDDIEVLVAATIEWDIILDGKPALNTPDAYRKAYARYPALKEQGDEFIGVRSNFIKT